MHNVSKENIKHFTAIGDITTLSGEMLIEVVLTGMAIGDVDGFWNSIKELMNDELTKHLCKLAVNDMLKDCDVTQVIEE